MKLPSQKIIHHFLLLVVAVLTASPLYATDEVELIPFGSSWRWHHPTNGADPGPTFQSTWMNAASSGFANTGTAPLGYGVSDWGALAQDIGTPPSGLRHTAYFKKTFSVPSELNGSFYVQLLCDDGAAIYIDGRPVGQFNFTVADSYTARASSLSDERRMQMVSLSVPPDPMPDPWLGPDQLGAGTHTIAVSVHNFDPTSSDLAFDLSLFFVPQGGLPTATAPDGRRFMAIYSKGLLWTRDEAVDQATRSGAKLATIRSQTENAFVFNLINKRRLWSVRRDTTGTTIYEGPLIGGLQLPEGTEPGGGWTWGDGTQLTYTAWAPSQPDESVAGQDAVRYWSAGSRQATWDDELLTFRFSSFVIELPPAADLEAPALISISPYNASSGTEISIAGKIRNTGPAASRDGTVWIRLYSGNTLAHTIACDLPSIASSSEYNFSCSFTLPSGLIGDYSIEVTPASVDDYERSNNTSRRFPLYIGPKQPQYLVNFAFDHDAPFAIKESTFLMPGTLTSINYSCFSRSAGSWTPHFSFPTETKTYLGGVTIKEWLANQTESVFRRSGLNNISFRVGAAVPGAFNVYFSDQTNSTHGGVAEDIYRFNSKGSGDALVFWRAGTELEGADTEKEAYARNRAYQVKVIAHEVGHLMGLIHAHTPTFSDNTTEVMDYTFAPVGYLPIFQNAPFPYCRSNAANGACTQSASLITSNPRYHLLKYVEKFSAQELAARNSTGGSYDTDSSSTARGLIRFTLSDFLDEAAEKRVRRATLCKVQDSGVSEDLIVRELASWQNTTIGEISHEPFELPGDSNLLFVATTIEGSQLLLTTAAAPSSPDEASIPILQGTRGYLIESDMDSNMVVSDGHLGVTRIPRRPELRVEQDASFLSLRFMGMQGQRYVLETSADLQLWSETSSANGNDAEIAWVTDRTASSMFFRVVTTLVP